MDEKALAQIPEVRGTDLANLNMQQIMYIGKLMFDAGMFTDIKSLATAQVKVMAGQELGLTPFQAMNSFHIIHGRATMAANLMATKIKGSGRYDYRVVVLTDDLCHIDVYELLPGGKREKIGESRFSKEDAIKAATQNRDKFARNMLFARAISNAAKWYCPDVFGGQAVYVPGEVVEDPEIINDAGETVEDIEARREEEKKSRREYAAKASSRRTAAKVAEQTPDKTDDKAEIDPEVTPEPDADVVPQEPEIVAAAEPDSAAEFDKAIASAGQTKEELDEIGKEAARRLETDTVLDPEFEAHTITQRKRIMAMLGELGFKTDEEKRAVYTGMTDKGSFKDLSKTDAEQLIGGLEMADPDWLRETYLEAANDGEA